MFITSRQWERFHSDHPLITTNRWCRGWINTNTLIDSQLLTFRRLLFNFVGLAPNSVNEERDTYYDANRNEHEGPSIYIFRSTRNDLMPCYWTIVFDIFQSIIISRSTDDIVVNKTIICTDSGVRQSRDKLIVNSSKTVFVLFAPVYVEPGCVEFARGLPVNLNRWWVYQLGHDNDNCQYNPQNTQN